MRVCVCVLLIHSGYFLFVYICFYSIKSISTHNSIAECTLIGCVFSLFSLAFACVLLLLLGFLLSDPPLYFFIDLVEFVNSYNTLNIEYCEINFTHARVHCIHSYFWSNYFSALLFFYSFRLSMIAFITSEKKKNDCHRSDSHTIKMESKKKPTK